MIDWTVNVLLNIDKKMHKIVGRCFDIVERLMKVG